jgi:hypothetical protein
MKGSEVQTAEGIDGVILFRNQDVNHPRHLVLGEVTGVSSTSNMSAPSMIWVETYLEVLAALLRWVQLRLHCQYHYCLYPKRAHRRRREPFQYLVASPLRLREFFMYIIFDDEAI